MDLREKTWLQTCSAKWIISRYAEGRLLCAVSAAFLFVSPYYCYVLTNFIAHFICSQITFSPCFRHINCRASLTMRCKSREIDTAGRNVIYYYGLWVYEAGAWQSIAFEHTVLIGSKKRFIFGEETITLFSDKPKRSIFEAGTQRSLPVPNNSIY